MVYVLLILGFVLLIKGADYFVEGASDIAIKANISPLIIGLTIVAFGTSTPEAAVSITSALKGQNDIAIGNVVGSNIFNLLMVVGVAAIIKPLKVQTSIIAKDFPFAILSAIVILVLGNDLFFQGANQNIISMGDGIVLLILFGIYMYYLIELAITGRATEESEEDTKQSGEINIFKSIIISLLGLVGVVIGGQFVVDSATDIAITWGMSEKLVGLTIVAIGTSLPELVTSIVAAGKGKSDMALGNAIGSTIFNAFFILGMSSMIFPIPVNGAVFTDMAILILITIVTYLFAVTKKSINKIEGIILVLTYIAYTAFIIIRN